MFCHSVLCSVSDGLGSTGLGSADLGSVKLSFASQACYCKCFYKSVVGLYFSFTIF